MKKVTKERKLAQEIVSKLFTDAYGNKAVRLKQMLPPISSLGTDRDGGAWYEEAAINAVERLLTPAKPK